MATIRILVGLIFCAVIGRSWMPERHLLKEKSAASKVLGAREKLLKIALQEVGVRELTGRNDGEKVERYLRYTGLGKGHAWCASYVSWVYGSAGYEAPRTAWTPSLFPGKRVVKIGLPGDVFGIYFSELKRIAHAGIVVKKTGDWLLTVEGNTNVNGSRAGDGVYCKRRHVKTIERYANWLDIPRIDLTAGQIFRERRNYRK